MPSQAMRLARELRQPFNQAIAATYLALLQQLRADPDTFRQQAKEALELSTEFKAHRTTGSGPRSSSPTARRSAAPTPPRVARLRSAIEAFKATGARLRLPYYLALLADGALRAGRGGCAGWRWWRRPCPRSRRTSERWWDAELHRLRAELLLAAGAEPAEAEAALRRALEIARGQQARIAGAARRPASLAGLWAKSGRSADARDLLAPVHAAFTEGAETPDLAVRPGVFSARACGRPLTAALTPA